MRQAEKLLQQLIKEVRASFQDLKVLADLIHGPREITASMRSVLEYLNENGDEAVPKIAKAKNVSRQHIQQIVDQLLEGGLVELKDNPVHQKSRLVSQTPKGHEQFDAIRKYELVLVRKLSATLDEEGLMTSVNTLKHLRQLIKEISL